MAAAAGDAAGTAAQKALDDGLSPEAAAAAGEAAGDAIIAGKTREEAAAAAEAAGKAAQKALDEGLSPEAVAACTSPPSRVTAEDAAISKASPWLSLTPLGTVIVPASLLGVALFALSRRRATRRSTAFEAVKTNPPSDARSSSSAAAAELV